MGVDIFLRILVLANAARAEKEEEEDEKEEEDEEERRGEVGEEGGEQKSVARESLSNIINKNSNIHKTRRQAGGFI